MNTILSADSITKSYRVGRGDLNVLKGINLDIEQAEVCAIMGASGSGKSTLLQILGLMDNCDSGSIKLNGDEISQLNSRRAAKFRAEKIGFVFQQF
ncbi:MAG: ATP-binding cassette domain-containing protein, partial [Planctomycetota bacterium]|nr:ATP-binding cassette domain-containing protein [Planctomycetota bacterium]